MHALKKDGRWPSKFSGLAALDMMHATTLYPHMMTNFKKVRDSLSSLNEWDCTM